MPDSVKSAVCLSTLLITASCFAFRPFKTDDAGTVPPAAFEIETAIDYWKDKAVPGFSLTHGITSRMDLGVSFGRCLLPKNESGFDGVHFGMKCAFIPDLLSASFCGTFSDPSFGGSLIVSQPVSAVSLHANAGFEATADTDNADFIYGVAAACDGKWVTIGIEINGANRELDWWQAAILFRAADWLIIDSGIGGDVRSLSDFTATTGLVFAFP